MSSTHEPPQLLEPTNLLEPLDLKHQDGAFAGASARGDSGASAQRRFTRDAPRAQRPACTGTAWLRETRRDAWRSTGPTSSTRST